jgi:DHA1 family multidrug resistance protein-like MFS transporter
VPTRVVTVSLVMALALLGDSLLYVVLPLQAATLGLSGVQVGVLLSANRFVRMVTNTGAARLLRRMPARPVFAGAAVLAALTTAMYTLTPAFLPFLAARLLWGFSYSALRLGCFVTVLSAATDRTRGRLMGLYQSVSRGGSFVAVVVGGALFDTLGYRPALLLMAAGTALALPLALWRGPVEGTGPPLPTPAPRRPRADPASTPRRAGARLLAVKWSAFALSFVARGVVTATLAVFLRQAFGERLGPGGALGVATVASWLVGVRWLAEIGLAAPLGALSDRVGRARAATAWLLVAAAVTLVLALAPALGVAVAAAAVLFVAASGLGATLDAAAGDLAPVGRRTEVMSAYADWADMGAALGPLLALGLAGGLGLRPTYAAGALVLGLGAAAFWATHRPAVWRADAPVGRGAVTER